MTPPSPQRYQWRLSSLAGILISPLLSCIFFFPSPCYVPVNSAAFKSRSSPSFYLSRERAGQEKQAIVSASRYRLVYNNKIFVQCHSGIWPLPPISAANTHSTVAGWRPPAGRPRMLIARPELMSGWDRNRNELTWERRQQLWDFLLGLSEKSL